MPLVLLLCGGCVYQLCMVSAYSLHSKAQLMCSLISMAIHTLFLAYVNYMGTLIVILYVAHHELESVVIIIISISIIIIIIMMLLLDTLQQCVAFHTRCR